MIGSNYLNLILHHLPLLTLEHSSAHSHNAEIYVGYVHRCRKMEE